MMERQGDDRIDREPASATTRSPRRRTRSTCPGCVLVILGALGAPGSAHASICDARSSSPDVAGRGHGPSNGSEPASTDAPIAPAIDDRSDSRRAEALRRLETLQELLYARTPDGGRGLRTRCRGDGERRREIGWRFDLEQFERVTTIDGQTLLTAFESRHTVTGGSDDRRTADTLVAEVVDLPARTDWTASADLSSLSAGRRLRRAGAVTDGCAFQRRPASFRGALLVDAERSATSCSYATEIDTTARLVDGTVELEQVFYIGGLGSERVVWRLRF